MRNEIKTDKFLDGIQIRHKIIKEATGVAFITMINGSISTSIAKKAEVAAKAIPECSIVFMEGDEMQTILSGYLNTLNEQNPETIGGQLPDEDFYYKR